MTIEFFMPMVPPTVTAQQREIRVVKGKPVVYDTAEISAARAKLEGHLAPHAPAAPLDGPVRLIAKWCWPCEGTPHGDGEWRSTKPDVDNITKMLNDAMEKLGFFTNDSRVASGVTEKFWAAVPGIYVRIEELA
jgi:Holliday junction resolvase RusA-like endonuclease